MANPNNRCCAASDKRSVVNDATDSSHAAEVIPLQDEEKLAVSWTRILAIIRQAEEEKENDFLLVMGSFNHAKHGKGVPL